LLVAAWHLSPELSHKRRKGFRAWAEPCVASIDAAGLGGGATLAEPGPAAGGGVGGPWTVIAIHASTDHRSPSAEAPVRPGRKGVGLQPATVHRAAGPMGRSNGVRPLRVAAGAEGAGSVANRWRRLTPG
jgi:hypothetical protein